MRTHLGRLLVSMATGLSVFILFHAEAGSQGRNNWAARYAAPSESADLLNGRFHPAGTTETERCRLQPPAFSESVGLQPGWSTDSWQSAAVDGVFFEASGGLGGCLERMWTLQGANSNRGATPLRAETALPEPIPGRRWPIGAASAFAPSGDASAYDYWISGLSDPQGFQLKLAFNADRGGNSLSSLPARSSIATRDYSALKEISSPYFGSLGGLLLPVHNKLGGMFSYDLRLGDSHISEHYSGLSNSVEQENPLLWYFSAFRRPLNPVTVNTSFKSSDLLSTNDAATDLVRADRFPFMKKDANFNLHWGADNPLSLQYGFRWQRWERDPEYWENASMDEYSSRVSLKIAPLSWVNVTASFSQSIRAGSDSYLMEADPHQPEQLLLPKFGLADRNRNRVDFTTEFIPLSNLKVALNYGFSKDSYENALFYLTEGTSWSAGSSITWEPLSRLAFTVNYQHDQFTTRQGSGITARPGIFETTDTLDTVGAAMTYCLIPSKLDLVSRGSYSVAWSEGRVGNVPDSTGRLSRFESFLRLRYTKQLSFRCGYMFEDFGTAQEFISFRDPLTNAPFSDYSAHVVLGVINYEF